MLVGIVPTDLVTPRCRMTALASTLLLAGACSVVMAQTWSAVSGQDIILGQLGSDDYATRQRITRQLRADRTLTDETLAGLLAASETPEQRHRLLDIARHHTLRRAREQMFTEPGKAAIGFTYDVLAAGEMPGLDQSAVQVGCTLAGFPAHSYLEPGDLIVAFDGDLLPDSLTPQYKLLSRLQSGDDVTMTVYRGGQRVSVQVRLARAEALSQMYAVPDLALRPRFVAAWSDAREQLLSHGLGKQLEAQPAE